MPLWAAEPPPSRHASDPDVVLRFRQNTVILDDFNQQPLVTPLIPPECCETELEVLRLS